MNRVFIRGYMDKNANLVGDAVKGLGSLAGGLKSVALLSVLASFAGGGGVGYLMGRTGGVGLPNKVRRKELVRNELEGLKEEIKMQKNLDLYKNRDDEEYEKGREIRIT